MTAPTLTAQATSGCPAWCADHLNGICTSVDDLFLAADGRHLLRARLEHATETPGSGPQLVLPDVDMSFDADEVRRMAARLTALADQIAQARR